MTPPDQSKNPKSPFKPSQLSKEYLSSLKAYWEWRPRICLERLTTSLLITESTQETSKFYRLWIELLALETDQRGLAALKEHFHLLIEELPHHTVTFKALQGLCCFELDEIEQASLIASCLKSHQTDHYVFELAMRLKSRKDQAIDQKVFQKLKNHLTDYFHLTFFAQYFYQTGQKEELAFFYNRILELYPHSPFLDLCEFQGLIDQNEFDQALVPARKLTTHFPLNPNYGFNLGYTYAKLEDYQKAIVEFERQNDLDLEQNVDTLNWYGYCLAKEAIFQEDQHLCQKAIGVLHHALELSAQLGTPPTFARNELNQLEDFFQINQDNPSPRVWLLKLPPTQYHSLRTAEQSHIHQLVAKLDPKAKKGDFCFVFGADHNPKSEKIRLGALYRVDNDPKFHPLPDYRNQAHLSLVNRLEMALPITIKGHDALKDSIAYEMEEDALRDLHEQLDPFYEEPFSEVFKLVP